MTARNSTAKGPGRTRGRGAPRSAGALWTILLLLALGSCAEGEAELAKLTAAAVTPRVHVFLIATGDGGKAGPPVGCGDSAVPVEVTLPQPAPALEGALSALLAMDRRNDPKSGLYNALYASRLHLEGVDRSGTQALVRLKGYLELGGECDDPRVLAQLEQTVLQFADVERVTFYLEGKPLKSLLGGRG